MKHHDRLIVLLRNPGKLPGAFHRYKPGLTFPGDPAVTVLDKVIRLAGDGTLNAKTILRNLDDPISMTDQYV